MATTLTEEQEVALAKAKELALEIERTVAESLAIQNASGYIVRNQAIKLNAQLEVLLPTPAPQEEVPTASEVIQPN